MIKPPCYHHPLFYVNLSLNWPTHLISRPASTRIVLAVAVFVVFSTLYFIRTYYAKQQEKKRSEKERWEKAQQEALRALDDAKKVEMDR